MRCEQCDKNLNDKEPMSMNIGGDCLACVVSSEFDIGDYDSAIALLDAAKAFIILVKTFPKIKV